MVNHWTLQLEELAHEIRILKENLVKEGTSRNRFIPLNILVVCGGAGHAADIEKKLADRDLDPFLTHVTTMPFKKSVDTRIMGYQPTAQDYASPKKPSSMRILVNKLSSYEHSVIDYADLKKRKEEFDFILLPPDIATPVGLARYIHGLEGVTRVSKAMAESGFTTKKLKELSSPGVHNVYKKAYNILTHRGKIIMSHSYKEDVVKPDPNIVPLKTKRVGQNTVVFERVRFK